MGYRYDTYSVHCTVAFFFSIAAGDKELKREAAAAFDIHWVAVLGIRSRMFFGLFGSGSISQRYGSGY
jgi:hypothetical protein